MHRASRRSWGRELFRLPYYRARIVATPGNEIRYQSARLHGAEARFEARYAATSEPQPARPGTLQHFLAERYCLYTESGGALFRAEIHHLPWPLQEARAQIDINTMAEAAGIELPEQPPLLQYASRLKVYVWPLHRVTAGVREHLPARAGGQVVVKPV